MPQRFDWQAKAERVAKVVRGCAATHDSEDSFVSEGYAALKEEGFFTALVPEELGGGGASPSEICAAIRILGSACGSTALAFSMHSHLVAVAAWRWKNQGAPTDVMLKRIAGEGLILVSSGGSDWLESGGTAEKVEGGFRISGRKPFSSGSPAADILSTSAVYDDPDAGPTVLHFPVPLKGEGVELVETWQVLGMRGTGSNDIVLDQVFVPEATVQGRRPKGQWHILFHIISMIAMPLIYSAYLGVAEGARDLALAAAKKRPGGAHLPQLAGEMENALNSARLAHRRMAELADTGAPGPETTSEVMSLRTLIAKAAIEAVERAMLLAGGGAFYRKMGLERAWRDVQAARFHPLQEKQQLELTGRVALGLDIDA